MAELPCPAPASDRVYAATAFSGSSLSSCPWSYRQYGRTAGNVHYTAVPTFSKGCTSIRMFLVSISNGEHMRSHVPLISTADDRSVLPELMRP